MGREILETKTYCVMGREVFVNFFGLSTPSGVAKPRYLVQHGVEHGRE
jgi:hypothetical protein